MMIEQNRKRSKHFGGNLFFKNMNIIFHNIREPAHIYKNYDIFM